MNLEAFEQIPARPPPFFRKQPGFISRPPIVGAGPPTVKSASPRQICAPRLRPSVPRPQTTMSPVSPLQPNFPPFLWGVAPGPGVPAFPPPNFWFFFFNVVSNSKRNCPAKPDPCVYSSPPPHTCKCKRRESPGAHLRPPPSPIPPLLSLPFLPEPAGQNRAARVGGFLFFLSIPSRR